MLHVRIRIYVLLPNYLIHSAVAQHKVPCCHYSWTHAMITKYIHMITYEEILGVDHFNVLISRDLSELTILWVRKIILTDGFGNTK